MLRPNSVERTHNKKISVDGSTCHIRALSGRLAQSLLKPEYTLETQLRYKATTPRSDWLKLSIGECRSKKLRPRH